MDFAGVLYTLSLAHSKWTWQAASTAAATSEECLLVVPFNCSSKSLNTSKCFPFAGRSRNPLRNPLAAGLTSSTPQ